MENTITSQLVMKRASSMENMFILLSIEDKSNEKSPNEFRMRIWSACNREIQRITELENSSKPNDFSLPIERLIEERHAEGNEETLLLLIGSKNKMRERIALVESSTDDHG